MKPEQMVSTSILIVSVLMLAACSSSQTKESDTDVIPPSTEAGTDSIPLPAADSPVPTSSAVPPAVTPDPIASPVPSAPSAPSAPSTTSINSTTSTSATSSTTSETAPLAGTSTGASESYTVAHGDTLMKIAFESLGDVFKWKEIYEQNKDQIKDPNIISAGLVLKISKPSGPVSADHNGEKYLIKDGDTLGKISNSLYGTQSKWKELWENNKQLIHNPNRIFSGFYLYYVPKEGATTSSSTSLGGSGTDATPKDAAPQAAAFNTSAADPNKGLGAPASPSAIAPMGGMGMVTPPAVSGSGSVAPSAPPGEPEGVSTPPAMPTSPPAGNDGAPATTN